VLRLLKASDRSNSGILDDLLALKTTVGDARQQDVAAVDSW
jgi:hypothetical protein